MHGALSLQVAISCDKKLGVPFHEGIILQRNNDHLFCFKAGIPKAVRQLVSKLAECGWLFNKVKNYVETRSSDKTFGLVGQVNSGEMFS